MSVPKNSPCLGAIADVLEAADAAGSPGGDGGGGGGGGPPPAVILSGFLRTGGERKGH